MLLTDETGSGTATLAYSAFGEPVGDAAALPTRYQFAGGHGYESGLLTLPAAPGTVPLTFQHLGARWYQPNTGRFIQRDPIGLAGGMNVYAYCRNNPSHRTDPKGLFDLDGGPMCWKCGRDPWACTCGRPKPSKPKPSGPCNGCTGVPDHPPGGVDFYEPCNKHDRSYANPNKTRLTADNEFFLDMTAASWSNDNLLRNLIGQFYACLYYLGVRAFGDDYYYEAQQEANGVRY